MRFTHWCTLLLHVAVQVRDREGAQQDLTSHCLAYKRRELAAMLGGSSLFGTSSTDARSGSSGGAAPDQQQAQQLGKEQQQQQLPEQPLHKPEPQSQQAQQPAQPRQQRRAFGMLLFSCNGRGTSLYNEPSWDSRTLAGYIPVPVSGFMCNGAGLARLNSALAQILIMSVCIVCEAEL